MEGGESQVVGRPGTGDSLTGRGASFSGTPETSRQPELGWSSEKLPAVSWPRGVRNKVLMAKMLLKEVG